MRRIALVPLLLLCACERAAAPEEENDRADDVALVEQAQKRHPPVEEAAPQPIAFTDIEQQRFFGAGCAFTPKGREGYEPVLYTLDDRGLVKLGGELILLAADTGSAEFPYGSREKYAGKEHSFRLTKGPGEGEVVGEESVGWPGSLTIRDRWDRIVYQSQGRLECGA
ncbi:MAG: hypothetical protein KDE55_21835 [Novosphingobium sp.]|nr:hypothetical protein [Novosphingobium sp.]MCB2080321.1 hypothetical protein [Novosphingobium sp.]